MDKRRDDIEKYLRGELTAAKMHALEKEALSDPFLAEALEGAALIDAVDFSKDISVLSEKIVKRKSAAWMWPARIAATLVLLAVSIFIIWNTQKQDPKETLALEQPTSNQDGLPEATTKPALAEADKRKEEPAPALTPAPKKENSLASAKTRSKKSSSEKSSSAHRAENKKTELAPELAQTLPTETKIDDNVSKRISENQLDKKREVTTLDPTRKNEIQLPSASEIKLAEGYIASIDARPTIVTGRVMSAEDGTPLSDVSIALKGTSVTTKTDAYGRYTITANSQHKEKTLVYSSEGLESTEVKIDGIDSTYLPVKIEMTDAAQEEAAVETSGMRDFGPTNVYTIPAHPETGNRAFKQYLEKSHKYPREAKETKVQGTVTIEFKVDAMGALSEFKIVRGIGNGCDEEVIRLILQGAKWVPTTKDGIPVNDKARVKFKFELEE